MPHSGSVGGMVSGDTIGAGSGVCPYARAFVNDVISGNGAAAVVVTTVCDQMRRASELIAGSSNMQVFLMNVPSTWQTDVAHKIYTAELERLGRFLVRLGGTSPSKEDLSKVICEYHFMRNTIRDTRKHLSARQYSEAIAEFHRNGVVNLAGGGCIRGAATRGVPLALIGGPLLSDHFHIFDMIELSGGRVVLDATETGERTMPGLLDYSEVMDDPFRALAEMYFGSIPDAFRRPNTKLYDWLGNNMTRRGVRGIILRRYIWCDRWHAEVPRLREWADVPLLDLDVGDDTDSTNRAASRIQSFMEMLR
jgi:benzoyl-CoA reductase/2-hydroxyglutaryl-CoA dehydratase subunit BcrC/BadD/HgdB